MTSTDSSSAKVPYDLRPRKQVERRMMLRVFQQMAESGFQISTYRYAGFGGFFFIDFILFRRFLGINDMVSIEHDTRYEKRVMFNLPFKNIEIVMQPSGAYIPTLNRDKPHILWLDYDKPIAEDRLNDIDSAAFILSRGSILIATFDVDFDKAQDVRLDGLSSDKRAEAWFGLFRDECGHFLDPTLSLGDFHAGSICSRTIEVANNAILSGINMRRGFSFEPLFCFRYADGHEMLTIGGIICSKIEKKKLRQIDWKELDFVRRDFSKDAFQIDVPVFTPKERLHIDSNMPCDSNWLPSEFEIDPNEIQKYLKVFKYCPLYAELLIR